MRIRWLEAFYGFSGGATHIAVSRTAEDTLQRMVRDVLPTGDLIAIYVPVTTSGHFDTDALRGRVVGAVRLLPMPAGKSHTDYSYTDPIDNSRRWPVGWPCETVLAPAAEDCPYLKPMVEAAYGIGTFRRFTAPMHNGPIVLSAPFGDTLLTRLAAGAGGAGWRDAVVAA